LRGGEELGERIYTEGTEDTEKKSKRAGRALQAKEIANAKD